MAAGLAKNHTLFGAALKTRLSKHPRAILAVPQLPHGCLMKVCVRSLAGDESVFLVEGWRRRRRRCLETLS